MQSTKLGIWGKSLDIDTTTRIPSEAFIQLSPKYLSVSDIRIGTLCRETLGQESYRLNFVWNDLFRLGLIRHFVYHSNINWNEFGDFRGSKNVFIYRCDGYVICVIGYYGFFEMCRY